VIFVDDGSERETGTQLGHLISGASETVEYAPEKVAVRAILLRKNAGQQQATHCGICHARGEIIVTMDDDLQHRPEDVPRMLEALGADFSSGAYQLSHTEADLVYAVPESAAAGLLRRLGSRGRDLIFRLAFGRCAAGVRPTSFRVFRRALVENLCLDPRGFLYLSAEFFRAGARCAHVTVQFYSPPEHPARYPVWKLVKVFVGLVLYLPIFPRFVRVIFGGAKWDVMQRINFPEPGVQDEESTDSIPYGGGR
jgi:undecaprenyl-phosphate 4-deoxy-4-formamido-L-arabinose transferase